MQEVLEESVNKVASDNLQYSMMEDNNNSANNNSHGTSLRSTHHHYHQNDHHNRRHHKAVRQQIVLLIIVLACSSFITIVYRLSSLSSATAIALIPESSYPTHSVTERDVQDLFTLWNEALFTKDPHKVAQRYTHDAVLLPTVSDQVRYTHELIEEYFVTFLAGAPRGKILESFVHIGEDWLSDVGVYEFTLAQDGSKVRGRYSFVYKMEDGEWKIFHHHSSMMPGVSQ